MVGAFEGVVDSYCNWYDDVQPVLPYIQQGVILNLMWYLFTRICSPKRVSCTVPMNRT